MRVSHGTLKLFAALTWYVGGGVLLVKGSGYLLGAAEGGPTWPAGIAGAAGVVVGLLRGRTLFLRACRRNLRRIDALPRPKAWQFFRPGFFLALAAMMAGGALLSWVAESGYWPAVAVGGLELVIAVALLTSSVAFWRTGAIRPDELDAEPTPTPSQDAA